MKIMHIMSSLNINDYLVKNIPATAFYVSEFITKSEEQALVRNIYGAPKPKWTQLSNRRLQNWGGVPHARGMVAESLPAWLGALLGRLRALELFPAPNHVLVNEYLPGQGIMPHVDGSLFYPTIATVSVGSHTVLKLSELGGDGPGPGSLLLEPRSLVVLKDQLYTHYMHCIEERNLDALDDSILNLDLCSHVYTRGSTIDRDTRISLTVRHVPKTTSFKINIGNRR